MKSHFFGNAEQPIYGVVQEPSGNRFESFAVLLCYPFGQEYMRGHRAFRRLSSTLADSGIATLRFDYRCTGDSFGEQEDFCLKEAREDIIIACDEIKSLASVESIYVVGLRLGAALAIQALSDRNDIRHFSLWDPVLNGEAYCQELFQSMNPKQHRRLIVDDTWWVNGFPVAKALRKEIEAIDLSKIAFGKTKSIQQVVSTETEYTRQFARLCKDSGIKLNYALHLPTDDDDWNKVDEEGSFLLPHEILRSIYKDILAV